MQTVEVGQVWEDCDKRMKGRRIVVERVDERYAYYSAGGKYQRRIRLDRMRPFSTGFRLVEGEVGR